MTLPKLHIRDLFWLVLVVGLVLGWWVDRRSTATEKIKLIKRNEVLEIWRTYAESLGWEFDHEEFPGGGASFEISSPEGSAFSGYISSCSASVKNP